MADEEVNVRVSAESAGEEVYDQHAAGIERVGAASEEAGAKIERSSGRFDGARAALSGLNLSLLSVERGMRFFGISNDTVTKAIDGMVTAITLARSVLAIHTAITQSATLANWARAASEVAASAWFAPVVLGIIIAAVGALVAYQTGILKFAAGGSVLLTKPTLMLGGEAGPEVATFTPVGGGASGLGSITVNNYIYTNDPEAAARAVTDQLIRLKGAGR